MSTVIIEYRSAQYLLRRDTSPAITYRFPSGSLTLLSRRSMYLDTTSGNFERRYLRSHVYANFSRSSAFFFVVLPS